MSISYRFGAVVIYDEKMYTDVGLVGRWTGSVTRELKRNTKNAAPSGLTTGRIRKSSYNSQHPVGTLKRTVDANSRQIGPRERQISVWTEAPYAVHVVYGTKTIYARSARIPKGEEGAGQFRGLGDSDEQYGMYIPANPGWGKAKWRQRVRGQKANNFFQTGMDLTSIRHPALRGLSVD